MLGGVVEELEQYVEIVGDFGDRFGILRPVVEGEGLDGFECVVFVFGVVDLGQRRPRAWVRRLGQRGEDVPGFVEPAALFPGCGEHVAYGFPEAEGAITDGQYWGTHAAPPAGAEQISPRLGGFTEPVSQRDEFLLPISADPNHDQQTHFVLIEADLEMDSVNPHIHVVSVGEGAFVERGSLVLPSGGQPVDRGRGQARGGAQERACLIVCV